MPTVPTYDNAQVSQNTLPQTAFAAPAAQPTAAQQAMDTGRAMSAAGQATGRIALDLQQQANELRVTDALNQAKETALRLTYDKDSGYTNLRGINALQRPDGKPLEQEYSEQLQKELGALAQGLGNDAQRAAFKVNADSILTNFRSGIVKHEADQFNEYSMSVSEGVQSTALREIGLNWNNPEVIDKAVQRIKAETYRQGQLLGKSAEWQDARTRELTSKAHLTALSAALDKNDPLFADGYLKKYGDQMQADDLLRARGLVNKEMDLQVGTSIGQQVMSGFTSKIAPTEYDRLQNIVNSKVKGYGKRADGTEKGTGFFGELKMKDGSGSVATEISIGVNFGGKETQIPTLVPTLSKDEVDHLLKGLPPTPEIVQKAVDHAKARIAQGKSPFANDGQQQQPLDEQIKKFGGDVTKALAAYKLGDKEVSALEKAHGANWLANAPKNVQEFVTATANEFGAGGGRGTKPTLAEMKAELRNNPALANNPLRLKHAEDYIETQYAAMNAAKKQHEEEALDTAYKALYANGGNMAALPAGLRAQIPGEKLDSVLNFAKSVAKGEKMVNNGQAWAQVLSMPKSELAKMSPSSFYAQYRNSLDDTHLEKGYALIAEANNQASDKHLEILTTDNRMKQSAIQAGILPAEGKPNEDQAVQFAQFQTTVDQKVRQFERIDLQGKRKATSEELQRIVDTTLMDKAFVPRMLWSDTQKPVSLMTPEDQARAYVTVDGEDVALTSIPVTQRALITSKLQARGLPVTEQAIAELWVRAGKPK